MVNRFTLWFHMKFKFIFTSALCVLFTFIHVKADEAIISKLANKSLLLDTATIANNELIAVGERGHVLIGTNVDTMVQQAVPSRVTLTAVTSVGELIWVAGHDLTILHSADNGRTWSVQYSDIDSEKPFLDILFFDAQHGIAIGAYGAFFRTLDGGNNWEKELNASLLHPDDIEYLEEIRELDGDEAYNDELSSILPHFNRITSHQDIVYMVGETGLIAQSADQGRTWSRVEIDYEGSFFAVNIINDQLIVGGLRGNTFIMNEDEWEAVRLCQEASVNSLVVSGSDTITALQNNGYITHIQINSESDLNCGSVALRTSQSDAKVSIVSGVMHNGILVTVAANGIAEIKNKN